MTTTTRPRSSEPEHGARVTGPEGATPCEPKLYAPKGPKAHRIKPYLTADHFNSLSFIAYVYSLAAGRPVSQSVLIRRAVELMADRAREMLPGTATARSEAAALLTLCRNEDAPT